MPTYRDLVAWQRGMLLAEAVYGFTKTLPPDERFGIASQLQRAAVSIPCNVAEGHCRRTTPAYAHHVSVALGSQGEIETLLELAGRMSLGEGRRREEAIARARETGRVLYGLYRSLNRKSGDSDCYTGRSARRSTPTR